MDPVLGIVLTFVVLGVIAMALASGAGRAERRPYDRLMGQVRATRFPGSEAPGAAAVAVAAPARSIPFQGVLEAIVDRISPRANQRRLLRRLEAAGVADKVTPAGFMAMRVMAAAGSVVMAWLTSTILEGSDYQLLASGAVLFVVAAFPDLKLRDQTEARAKALRAQLPDVLDLLVLSVEVGLGFDAAVARVTRKMEGPLVDELKRLLRDMQLGQTRSQSLRALAARCQVKEIAAFTAAIVQAEQLGGSIASALRVQSQVMRVKYSQRLREQAAKLPIKMLFPLIVFIFPAIFIVLLGPGMMSMIAAFG